MDAPDTFKASLWESIKTAWTQENLNPLVKQMYRVAYAIYQLSPEARVWEAVTGDKLPLEAIESSRKSLREAADFIYSAMPDSYIEGKNAVSIAELVVEKPLGMSAIGWGIEILLNAGLVYTFWKVEEIQDWLQEVQGAQYRNLATGLLPATLALQQANGDEKLAAEILAKGMEPPVFVKVDAVDYRPVLVIGGAALALGLLIYAQTR